MSLPQPPERSGARKASTLEPPPGHVIVASMQQRLCGGISPPKGVKSNPTPIQIDLSSNPRLTRRSKDRGDVQAQAETADPPDGIGELVRSLKARIVIELSVGGQSAGTPMLDEGVGGPSGGDRALRPGGDQAPVQRDPIQDFHFDSPFDHQAFDDVEAVQLALASSDIRKIPARWRRRPSLAPTTVQGAAPLQDPGNGSPRRQGAEVALLQLALNRSIPILAQGAVPLQFATQGQIQIFRGGGGSSRVMRDRWSITPLHAIQALAAGAANPVVEGRQTHVKAPGYRAEGVPIAHRRYHRFTPPGGRVFESCSISVLVPSVRLPMTQSVREVLTVNPFGRPAVAREKAFGRY